MFGTPVSDMQSDVSISGKNVRGTLHYLSEGALPDRWGTGNFLALKFDSDDWSDFTSVKVGLEPSVSEGFVEVLNDPDKNGAFKITNTTQKFKVVATNGTVTKTDTYDLSQLVLESE